MDGLIKMWARMVESSQLDLDEEEQLAILKEDKEGRNINKAEKWIKQNHPEVIGRTLDDGTEITPRVLTQEIRNMVPSSRLADCKFLVGVTRLYFEMQSDVHNFQRSMGTLNKILKILATAHVEEYDNDLNGLSFKDLDEKFRESIKKDLDSDKEEIGKLKLIQNSEYDIVPIDSFEDAMKYGEYTSWCVTHHEDMYDSYTKGGLGRFYFCLQKGFEDVQEVEGEGCPMDAYGKSMIAISVNDDGSLNTCTCRWNHANGANDTMMDTKQISEFFGVNFYETFKPYDTDYLWKKIVKNQVPVRGLDDDPATFCKTFDCVAIYDNDDEYDSSVNFKKLVDGKIVTLPFINPTTTLIDGKFVTLKDGRFTPTVPSTIDRIPKDIKGHFVIPDGVTSIGEDAFFGCSGLTGVTIPDSVTSIEDNAFVNCRGLTSVTIPTSVTSIGYYAFSGCRGLTSMMIPDSVTNIGYYAFEDCDGLTNVVIGSGVTSIGYRVFSACSGLTSMTIPDSVTRIGEDAFLYCTSLTNVTIPDSVTSIGCRAFGGCSSLTSVTIPNSVTSIGGSTFDGCTSLTSVTIPNSVTSIGDHAFEGCAKMTSVTIPNGVMRIGSSAFFNCSGLTNVTIPNSVMSIESYAFSGCSSLTSVTIPDRVMHIGKDAFGRCNLENVSIPERLDIAGSGIPSSAKVTRRKSASTATGLKTR